MQFWPEIKFNVIGIVFLVYCFMILIQLWYFLNFNLRLSLFKPKQKTDKLPALSVILCARNEEDNLFKHLPSILEQDYPTFEVIVVNDMSVDESKHIIKAYQEQYKHLRIIEIEKNRHRKFGKKMPLTIGIKGAKYDKLVMIDADCYPASKNWLKLLAANYTQEKEIVLGYGPYEQEKTFLNKIIRFDTTVIGINYLSFALAKRAYMGVGRNMSYSKDKFFEIDGFKNHYHIQSGDDDLFVKEAANKKNVSIEINPDSFVFSYPKKSFSEWVKQKQRHFTTAPHYRLINKLLLGIFPLSMFIMLFSFLILLFNFKWWWIVSGMLLLRYLMMWLINGILFRKLGSKDLIAWIPVLELIHFIIMPFIYYSTDRKENSRW